MSATTPSFRFFDLPTELRLLVYTHLHTPRCVVQQVRLSPSSETSGQIEFKYMTFAVGVLATCKLMRDEVQPFFVKALKTGDLETTHTFKVVDDNVLCAKMCLLTTIQLMQVFGYLSDKEYATDGFKNQIQYVSKFGYHLSPRRQSRLIFRLPDPRILRP